MHKKLIAASLLSCSFAVASTVIVDDDATKDITFTSANSYVIAGVTNVKTATNTAGAALTIDFGEEGCLVANTNQSTTGYGGGVNFSKAAFNFTVTLTLKAEDVEYLISHGDFERVLIDASLGEGNYHDSNRGGIWNVDCASLTLKVEFDSTATKEAWQGAGLVTESHLKLVGSDGKSAGLMPEEGQFGLALRSGHGDTCEAPSKLVFVANVPEPATATLSLLALAGLAARRRRH